MLCLTLWCVTYYRDIKRRRVSREEGSREKNYAGDIGFKALALTPRPIILSFGATPVNFVIASSKTLMIPSQGNLGCYLHLYC